MPISDLIRAGGSLFNRCWSSSFLQNNRQNVLTFQRFFLLNGDSVTEQSSSEGEKGLQTYVNLIAEHQWALRGFILSLMPSSPDVDDVLQETNIVLWQKRDHFEEGTNFPAWACTIAKFQVMRHLGKAKRNKTQTFSDDFIIDFADKLTPENSKKHRLQALDACLEKLDGKQRQLLMTRYSPGKSLQEYAEKLGTSVEVLRVTLFRVRNVLRRCIETQLKSLES